MTGSSAAPERSGFAFSDEARHRIFSEYVSYLLKACDVFRVPHKHLEYSERELAMAVEESEIDLRAMLARRSPTRGISQGKIAGVLAFRLSRFKIVHFREDGWANSNFHLVQELAATLLVRKLFVQRGVPEKNILELSYQLSRRHANQETAGLFFDAFVVEPAG
ncbi:hypothetical protein [Azospirillum canadense]|uniref:hypothetical protein n=1 Tax=Azospirillum canadense TaxID=403962 RepID=UPI00222742FB|nr:hypothetical protein [Azospirillum canadense]MCW2235779.1 hypothetical protein [Azospirillum canadense]